MSRAWTPWRALALYVVTTVAMTWPLTTQISSALPGDFGDSLLNCWILSWGSHHLALLAGGHLDAYSQWWNANIFHPAPLALAYSEHLVAQVLAGFPIWLATGNVLLVYNVLYLSSFVLCGLGMYLLVRELTGSARAAVVAGLFFAFVPYRVSQTAHVQVLWAQWMPLTIYAFRRYLVGGRGMVLLGATASLVAQQLSCGYYLVYFTPFLAAYLVWEITARRRWSDLKLLASLAVAGVADIAVVWPFVTPYLALRSIGFPPRPLTEIAQYSADVYGYVTAHPALHVWGWMTTRPRVENDLFPGALPILAACGGLIVLACERWRATAKLGAADPRARRASVALAVILALGGISLAIVVATGGTNVRAFDTVLLRLRSIDRSLLLIAVGGGGLLVLSRRARAWLAIGTDMRWCALVLMGAAVVLSLGPEPRAGGRLLPIAGPYAFLYAYVPGFDGLRVPARLAMIAYVFAGVVGGYGLAALERVRRGGTAVLLVGVLFLVEAAWAPIELNQTFSDPGLAAPPPRVFPAHDAPAVYHALRALPSGTVVAELPFGFDSWELRYVFYAAVHMHPLVNGYSGGFPNSYLKLAGALMRPVEQPDKAWHGLLASGATHVVVHRGAYLAGRDTAVIDWLTSRGARHVAAYGPDELFEVPPETSSRR